MRLFQLAYACRIYEAVTAYDESYSRFLDKTAGNLNFNDRGHLQALLSWLNEWGCRQFATDYHDLAAKNIRAWALQWELVLPARRLSLHELSDEDIQRAGDAFHALSQSQASDRFLSGRLHRVQVGPTGAAKILFAARPSAFPPWDDPIRKGLGLDGRRRSYCAYLSRLKREIQELVEEAARGGIPCEEIPRQVGRLTSTLPKLVDEYNWVTITKGVRPVRPEDIDKWHRWVSV